MEASIFTPMRLFQPNNTRLITPSPEKTRVLTSAHISPKNRPAAVSSTPKLGTPSKRGNQITVVSGTVDLPSPSYPMAFQSHITLDFTLRNNDGTTRRPTQHEVNQLSDLFPTQYSVSIAPPFLVIRVQELPKKRWPTVIAGLPLFLTTDPHTRGHKHHPIGAAKHILSEQTVSRNNLRHIFEEATKHLEAVNVRIDRAVWFGDFFEITVSGDVRGPLLPGHIANVAAEYKRADNVVPPKDAARRIREPSSDTNVRDNSIYLEQGNLGRPGMMVSSRRGQSNESELLTTSGIAVRDKETGERYVTFANHGFRPEDNQIHQGPDSSAPLMAEIVRRIPELDICLARLRPTFSYTNSTFGTDRDPVQTLTGFEDPQIGPKVATPIYMNNPFTGATAGTTMAVEFTRIPPGQTTDPNKWYVTQEWMYFGNHDISGVPDLQATFEGSCGSPITDDAGSVVAFFRYRDEKSGECVGLSAKHLEWDCNLEVCAGGI